MKVLIIGIDGYIGYSLALHLLKKGYEVSGIDNYSRRKRVAEVGSDSLTPIAAISARMHHLNSFSNFISNFNIHLGVAHPDILASVIQYLEPDTIVHLGEMPSAPWSMQDAVHAGITQQENVIGTLHLLWCIKEFCPEAHLIKLGTMGEYGTPNCDIPEGKIPIECVGTTNIGVFKEISGCPMKGLLFPRTAGSFYHLSKVHDTHNIEFACRTWGLRSTDIMQGVVFGLNEFDSPVEITRFDYDEYFGTVINRFCAQSLISHPLTIYGKGGQTRGYLPLKDSIQCLNIVIDNPPKEGEYRTLNQFESTYTINELAACVTHCAQEVGLDVDPGPIANPRVEAETHYYNPHHNKLFEMGYVPTEDIKSEISKLIQQLIPYASNVRKEVILPKTTWR